MAQRRDPDRIQDEIYQTQARMSRTIDELQDRLQPKRLKEQVTSMFGSSQQSRGRGTSSHRAPSKTSSMDAGHVADMARDNILPIAMIGLGLGWLVWSNTSHPGADRRIGQAGRWARERTGTGGRQNVDHHRYAAGYGSSHDADVRANLPDHYRNDLGMAYGSEDYDTPAEYHYRDSRGQGGQGGRGYTDRARDAAGRVGGAISGYAGNAADAVSDYAGRARGMLHSGGTNRNYGSSSTGLMDTVEQHPLLSGVIGFAVGAAVGAALPSSDVEDEWLGSYRDRMLDQGASYGSEAFGRATEVARDAVQAGYEAARETVQEEAEQRGLTPEKLAQAANGGGNGPSGGGSGGQAG